MAESIRMDVRDDNIGSDKSHGSDDRFDQKVSQLEKVFLIANFILELPSAAFDQLSSVHKPQYALFSMLMSFIILIVSVIDLVHKGRKKGVILMKKRLMPWFYYPHPNHKPFGNFPDIVGLLCAAFQCMFASLAYALLSRRIDNPVKASVWPIIFAFGLLCSRLSGNPSQKRPTTKARKLSRAIEFTLAELAAATNDFSIRNKVGTGRYFTVYRGKLADGREVAVKRVERGQERIFSEEENSAFESELEILSRLHHKHLVRLIGYYADDNERILVCEYINHGGLDQHLHGHGSNSAIYSWRMRIKVALDAARGIHYLHYYAVPPVIHRDIKSSSILLDGNWTARVAQFAFSLKGTESEQGNNAMKAEGTVGYIDPEYYSRNIWTAKSDVYSFGVVLLELLTGKRAIFKYEDGGGKSTSVVDFAVPKIVSGEIVKALDRRVSPPKLSEAEAVELMAYTALHCVNLEGRQRPNMTDVVANLERSLALCNGNSDQD